MTLPFGNDREPRDAAKQRPGSRPAPPTAPWCVTTDVAANAGCAVHHPMCAVPITEPMMKKNSVISIRVLPPPTLKSVPDAQPPPSCMPRPKMNAPAATPTPTGEIEPRSGLPEHRARRQQRKEHRAGDRQHQHLRAQAGAAPIGDEHPPRRREPERGVVEHHAGECADDEQRRLPPADDGVQIPRCQRDGDRGDRRRAGHQLPAS